jgi:predicted transcriptional regulator
MSQTLVGLTADQVVSAMGLPAAAMVNQRVPKKMLLENGAPTAADRKLIQDHIEEVTWVAALKPANAGVPDYQDAQRTYLELAVLSMRLA